MRRSNNSASSHPILRYGLAAWAIVVIGLSPYSIAAEKPRQVKLENDRVTIVLDEAAGAPVSLIDRASGRELLATQKRPALFQLEFSERGDPNAKRFAVTNLDAVRRTLTHDSKEGRSAARLAFFELGQRPIEVTCTAAAAPGDRMIRWRLEAKFPESLVLESVRYPILVLRTPTGPDANDALVLGSTKGGVHHRPSVGKPGQVALATQPGNLAAQFGCYYDPAGGVFTAALDTRGYRKTIWAARTGEGLSLAWQQACFQTSPFALDYDLVTTTFASPDPSRAADWRDAADLYKEWAVRQPWCRRTFAERDDLPAWLREGPAMVRFGREWLSQPESIERWLKDYWRPKFGTRIPLIVAYWGWEKVATWITPDYFPVYPSDEAFRRLTRVGREMNAHAFLWPSGYHYTLTYMKRPDGTFEWDDRARFDAQARPHAVCGRDGKALIGDRFWLQGGQTATLCGGDPWTIDWFNRIAVGCVERGAELVQIDQVVGGAFPPCYSTAHGHAPGPGVWATDSFHRQLKTALEACRKVDPGAVMCFEEPNELFIQEIGIQDYRDWEAFQRAFRSPGPRREIEPASVFGYLYHEYLPAFQSNPRSHDRLQAAHCLVTGQIPHLIPSRRVGPGPLLANGQFEERKGSQVSDWPRVDGYQGRAYSGATASDDTVCHGGRASVRLTNTESDQLAQMAQNVDVGGEFRPGRNYRLSAWMKSGGLKQPNAIAFAAFTTDMKALGSWHIPMPRTAGDWSRAQADFTLPQGAQFVRIMLNLRGPGTIWLDDLALEEVRADGTTVVVPRPTEPADHELMRQWVELFHGAGRPYLLLGRMLHPPRLEIGTFEGAGRPFPCILHNAFQAADGSSAVVLINVTDTPQTGQLTWQGRRQAITLEPWRVKLVK